MYQAMYNAVSAILQECRYEATKTTKYPFRDRAAHSWRVYQWAKRLIENGDFGDLLDRDAVYIAALFHDVGYATALDASKHAENSAALFRQYARENNLNQARIDFIAFLIENHSRKDFMRREDTPLELILLMEADLLDETGAMCIVWDCMAEGGQTAQSYEKAYRRIMNYTVKTMLVNPMRTEIGKKYWAEKQALTSAFTRQLASDLAIEEDAE